MGDAIAPPHAGHDDHRGSFTIRKAHLSAARCSACCVITNEGLFVDPHVRHPARAQVDALVVGNQDVE
jgi:hypothetical protein